MYAIRSYYESISASDLQGEPDMKRDGRKSLQERTRGEIPHRVVIENVSPEIDGGRFPAKRTVGEKVTVTADIHTDGHVV